MHLMGKEIVVVDFGSQTAHLIGRRFRQLGIGVEYIDPEEAVESIKQLKPKGLVLSGGPASVYEEGAPTLDKAVFKQGIPILGICYGWQLMTYLLGGHVHPGSKEYGLENLFIYNGNSLGLKYKDNLQVVMSHGDTVIKPPSGFQVIGSTDNVVYAAAADEERKLYGLHFHPEAKHTEQGLDILKNFAVGICGLETNPLKLEPDSIIEKIRGQVGEKKVVGAVSGGVDSTVAAFLIGKAIGKNLIPVYVESGLMRQGTEGQVRNIFSRLIEADLTVVQARSRFMKALEGVTDPEEKRKIIGKLYVDLFREEANLHEDVQFLAQGTIYSDVIESKGSKKASHIKAHHNVGGLPDDLDLELLEPLRSFFKDEVRELGLLAGLPKEVVMQQPFPGPGYAVRIRGEVTEARLAQVKKADEIVMEEMKRARRYDEVFQCFAVMTGAFSTAVKGDARAFAEVIAIRAYESDDVMTSDWADLPRLLLQRMSSRIVNEVPEVSRVVYDITTKPPATMEWE